MVETLKTCALCGGSATVTEVEQDGQDVCGRITCTVCGMTVKASTLDEAIAKWNSRAEETDPEPEPPDPPDTDSEVRFFPTNVMTVDVGSGGGGLEGWCNQIREIKSYANWGAAGVLLNWDDVETDERGVYDFTILDTLMDTCKECGKGLHLGIKFQWFGGTTSPEGKLPKYLDTIDDGKPGYSLRPEGEDWAGNLSLYVHLHDEEVMTAFCDMYRAVAKRYANDATLRMIAFGETAVDAPKESGFTTEKLFNQTVRWGYEMRQAFPCTEVRVGTNYLGDPQTMCELLDELDAYDVTPGGPDNYSRSYDSNLAMLGQVDGNKRKGRCAWVSENQRPVGSSGGDDTSSDEVVEHNNDGEEELGGNMDPHYFQWSRNYDDFDPWPDIRDFVNDGGAPVNTTNPHAGKKVRHKAPKARRICVTKPTRPGIDDAWPRRHPYRDRDCNT